VIDVTIGDMCYNRHTHALFQGRHAGTNHLHAFVGSRARGHVAAVGKAREGGTADGEMHRTEEFVELVCEHLVLAVGHTCAYQCERGAAVTEVYHLQ
jgi:hypothetical protein